MVKATKSGLFHAGERDGVQYRKASLMQMIAGNADSGTGVIFYLILGYASMIAPQGYGIPTMITGFLLTATRMVDGVSDAVVAAVFEKMNPKRGKIRIFLLAGWAIAAFVAMLLYDWAAGKFDGILGIIVFVVVYILFDIGHTINGVAGGTVGVVMTNDPTQRPMVSLIGTIYSYTVPLIFVNLITFVILPKHDNLYNVEMLGEVMVWMVAGSLIFTLIACWGIREVDVAETFATLPKEDGTKAEKVTLKDMWSVLKDNRNVQMYMLTGISDKLAQQTMSQSVVSTLLGGVLIGSYMATTMVGNISQIVGILFAFFGGIFVAKWGAKKSTVVWSWISIFLAVANVGLFLIVSLANGGVDGMKAFGVMGVPVVLYAILNLAKTGANMALTLTGGSMRSDLVDYEYERSGKYMPAVVAGVYSLIDKIVSSFASTIAMACIALVGYTAAVPQMGDRATWPIFWVSMFLSYGMGILGWLCNVIAMKFYTLDRERMVEVQKNLNARREASGISEKE